jgi:FixJ family two-component response regulator
MSESSQLIAVLDDDLSVRKALSRLLRSAGFAVASYATGGELLEALASTVPDCLILDLHMREMSGVEVQARISARGLRFPIIVITAYDSEPLRDQVMAAGAAAYLLKPFPDEALLNAVSSALSRT